MTDIASLTANGADAIAATVSLAYLRRRLAGEQPTVEAVVAEYTGDANHPLRGLLSAHCRVLDDAQAGPVPHSRLHDPSATRMQPVFPNLSASDVSRGYTMARLAQIA